MKFSIYAGKYTSATKMASKNPHGEKLFDKTKQVLQSSMHYIDQLSQQAKTASSEPSTSGRSGSSGRSLERASDEFWYVCNFIVYNFIQLIVINIYTRFQ